MLGSATTPERCHWTVSGNNLLTIRRNIIILSTISRGDQNHQHVHHHMYHHYPPSTPPSAHSQVHLRIGVSSIDLSGKIPRRAHSITHIPYSFDVPMSTPNCHVMHTHCIHQRSAVYAPSANLYESSKKMKCINATFEAHQWSVHNPQLTFFHFDSFY